MKAYLAKTIAKLVISWRYSSKRSLRRFFLKALWDIYLPPQCLTRPGAPVPGSPHIGIIAPNGTIVRYGTFRYWWYCVFG